MKKEAHYVHKHANFVTTHHVIGHFNVGLKFGEYITCKKFWTILILDKNSVRK